MNRPLDPGFDPRIADWLEADPSVAPREVLGTVLAAVPSVPQRRRLRVGSPFAPAGARPATLLAAGALVAVVVVGGFALSRLDSLGRVTPSPTPSAAASPSAPGPTSPIALPQLDRRYVSRIHPLAFDFPGDWVVTPASVTHPSATDTFADLDAFDRVGDGQSRFIVASAPLGSGESLDTFRTAAGAGACGVPIVEQATRVVKVAGDRQGDVAYVIARDCGELGPYRDWWRAVAVRDGTVFEFQLDGTFSAAEGDALFEAFLFGVELQPAVAPSPSGLDATFTSARYGYSVAYPATWTASPAAAAPGTIDDPYPGLAGPSPFDELDCGPYPPGCGDPHVRYGTFWGIAAAAPDGQTPDAWVAANHAPACLSGFDRDTVTIDGHPGFITEGGCDAGLAGYHYVALVAANGLVYQFRLTSPDAFDERFLAMLASIHLGAGPPSG